MAEAKDSEYGRTLLDEILRQTSSEEPAASPRLIQSLIEVARQHQNEPLCVEPVASELVSTALRGSLVQSGGPQDMRAMSVSIAQSLCDDPVSRPRLESLWERLVKLSRGAS